MFDQIVCSHEDAARLLDESMRKLMDEETGKWIFIHPLYRVFAKPRDFEFNNLSIVDPDDVDFWRFDDGRLLLGDWDPCTGCFRDGRGIGFRPETHHSFLVGKYEGSKQGVKERFKADGQQMMAAAYAFWRREQFRHKVKAMPDEGVLAFHSASSGRGFYEFSELGQIYPCYGDEMHVDAFASELLEWNSRRDRLAPPARSRINTALRFINLAMCSKDISAYINYFISIDALFGEYGKVESGILAGVQDVCSLPGGREKIDWLFALRNEIVHGGSRSVHEWARYPRYLKHFESDPVRDIEEISLDCIRNFCRN